MFFFGEKLVGFFGGKVNNRMGGCISNSHHVHCCMLKKDVEQGRGIWS